MVSKDVNIFNSKSFQNIPKLGVWYENTYAYQLATLPKIMMLQSAKMPFYNIKLQLALSALFRQLIQHLGTYLEIGVV
jgi:hypothetical protein